MAIDATIPPETQILLQFAEEEALVRTIWSLSPEQKKSHLFKQLGEQRYLSALRSGGIANAEMTRAAFTMDPYFLKSKVVSDAARVGLKLQIALGHSDVATRIKELMHLDDEILPGDLAGTIENKHA
jgi:hypothetical protein